MPADRRTLRGAARRAIGLVLCAQALPWTAAAQTGTLTIQYQRLEVRGRVFRPDGTFRDTLFTQSFWNQNYLVSGNRRVRSFELSAVGQYTQRDFVDRPDQTRTPYGLLRVSHPVVGLTASYRPVTTRREIAAIGAPAAALDTAATGTIEEKAQDATLSAYLAPPRLPRFDASLIRRHRSAGQLSGEGTDQQRNARASYELGALALRAGYTDIARGVSHVGPPEQKTIEAGFGYAAAPFTNAAFQASYDFTRFSRGRPETADERTLIHTLSTSATYRQTRTLDWGCSYFFRGTDQQAATDSRSANHDGQLFSNWHPNRVLSASIGGGARTTFSTRGDDLERFATATATVQGPVRPGWTGTASGSRTQRWDREGHLFSVNQGRVSSGWRLRPSLDVGGDAQVSTTRDTSGEGSVVTQWSLLVAATPWRTLGLNLGERRYRVMSGGAVGEASTRSTTLDTRWTPWRAIEILGTWSRSAALPRNDPRSTTTRLNANWAVVPNLRLEGFYTRTSTVQTLATVTQVIGREVLGGRGSMGVGRRGMVTAGLNVVEPGTPSQAKQFDASYQYRFGR